MLYLTYQGLLYLAVFVKKFEISTAYKDNSFVIIRNLCNSYTDVVTESSCISENQNLESLDDLCPEKRALAEEVIKSFESVSSKDRLGHTNKITMSIDTGDLLLKRGLS